MSAHEPRKEGPDCPRCGCVDTELLQRIDRRVELADSTMWGEVLERLRCNHCGHAYYYNREPEPGEEVEPVAGLVIYTPIRCPDCNSKEVRTTSTRRPVRYHKCGNCGRSFQSVEER